MLSENCTGCGACVDCCPHGAIKMVADNEGFRYPKIDKSLCISCGLCKKTCPEINAQNNERSKKYFAAKSVNEETQINSASGGVFPVLAAEILKQGGVVWGASFDSDFNVVHCCALECDDLASLRRSKYVQSNLETVYKSIKAQLESGLTVLFCGTPCQTTALSHFIPEKYKGNLILMEIICHGVPSPSIWQDFLKMLSDSHQEKIENIRTICFKYKDNDKYKWTHPGFYIQWKSGKEYLDYSNASWYENGFLGNLYVRPSCHKCPMKPYRSIADISLGDFWGCNQIFPDFFDENGVSIIITKSDKGNDILIMIADKLIIQEITEEAAEKYNRRIVEPARPSDRRKQFWRTYSRVRYSDLSMDEMEKIISKNLAKSKWKPLFAKMKYHLRKIIINIK